MRHRKKFRKFNTTQGRYEQIRKGIVNSLFTHERIITTEAKAKEFRREAEKLITMARKAHHAMQEAKTKEEKDAAQLKRLHYIRLAIARIDKKKLWDREGEPVLTETDRIRTVIQKLFDDLGPRFADRPGGYTRILHLAGRRLGDNAPQVLFELIPEVKDEPEPTAKKKKKADKKK